jgi:hypothetical protein
MGKTETIKQRSIYVYLPSLEQKDHWEETARKQRVSISRFVVEHVENSLMQEEDQSFRSRGALEREIVELKKQLRELGRKNRVLEVAFDRLEDELRGYRNRPFLDEDFVGVRRYQRELIEILREGRFVSNNEILDRLGVKVTDQDSVKAVSKQLENLEGYGIIRSSPKGWKWLK